ncbi:Acetolactate synthase isozyme 3 large subunit [Pigmentiphaga humi]|uniref:Acetolactate synthase isozyme 3 large subunit n=1 Tax=Pigmentiphaga humi TaxID=2478468 RepID=A0A3P4B581_9BURK|nr:thiamine pyrophosphate-requiring protein [Pigmentiphaga humi]VCU71454.1 Acetolactate synthase isozyme 3 large subunit [Pigmentiphaga humi]
MMNPSAADSRRPSAGYLLEALNEVGIEYLFCNMGTDHAPIIEELAARRKRGERCPQIVLCPHENTAIHMAGGYAAVTGKGQGVLVHVDVGTANAANGMHNLLRSRLPALLMAGKAPYTTAGEMLGTRDTYVHFVQEPFDQGSLVRPYVKWEWTLPSGIVAKEAVRRAHAVMHSEPRGPAYLMLPRETLTEPLPPDRVKSYGAKQFGAAEASGADPELVDRLARRLLAAEHPILITAFGGRNARTSELIEALAQCAGIRVFESNSVNNISHEGAHFCGFQVDQHLPRADVGMLVDVDVPWFPRDVAFSPDTFWAQIDVDVLKSNSPMWTFPADLRIQGSSDRVLEQLLDRLRALGASGADPKTEARSLQIAGERRAWREQVARRAEDPGRPDDINPHYLFDQLGKRLQPSDLVFNEAVRNAGALSAQLPRPRPGTLMRVGGGGLGASGGMALGAKLAAPERMVVQVVGDGSFYFGNMDSVMAVSAQYRLPLLVIVLDNGGWSAVKESTLRVYPEGDAREQDEFAANFTANADFSKAAEVHGAHGEILSDPGKVCEVLDRCIGIVESGRTALVHVKLGRI